MNEFKRRQLSGAHTQRTQPLCLGPFVTLFTFPLALNGDGEGHAERPDRAKLRSDAYR